MNRIGKEGGAVFERIGESPRVAIRCACRVEILAVIQSDDWVTVLKRGMSVEVEPGSAFTVYCRRCGDGWRIGADRTAERTSRPNPEAHRRRQSDPTLTLAGPYLNLKAATAV